MWRISLERYLGQFESTFILLPSLNEEVIVLSSKKNVAKQSGKLHGSIREYLHTSASLNEKLIALSSNKNVANQSGMVLRSVRECLHTFVSFNEELIAISWHKDSANRSQQILQPPVPLLFRLVRYS
jgi:hypothetical protein